ncbi:hypothetical protein McPS_02700 [Marichromatium sp. PS1]|uniref:glycosyltransferase n=1 Tax=Marichromatium sp. PS1 TaxID=3138932 RepID=UPI0032E6F884
MAEAAPRVSVVVPAYQAEATLGRCLDALLAQHTAADDYEVILVDDGSRDRTAEIARRYPLRYVHQANAGPAAARNHGARLARGELLLFTDSDCVPAPDWIERMRAPFADPEVMAVKGAYRSDQPQLVARFVQLEFEQRFARLRRRARIDMVDTYSAGYRRAVFVALGGFDPRFPKADNEDTELSYRMAARGMRMVFAPDAVVSHFGHPDSVWRYARLKFSRGYWRMVVYKRHPGKMVADSYTPQTLKLQILAILALAPALALAPWWPRAALALGGATLAAFLLSATPFLAAAWRRDRRLALAAPALLLVRAAALGGGAVAGSLLGRLGAGAGTAR